MAISSNKQLKAFYAQKVQEYLQREQVKPICPYFGECGGCALQHISYQQQLQLKQEVITAIFSGLEVELSPWEMVGSPDEYNYRLRMDYVVSHDPFHPPTDRLGLRKRKQFNHVIDLAECHLIPPQWFTKVREIYNLAQELKLPNYDLVSNKGYLRYLVIRVYGQAAMLNIVTQSTDLSTEIAKLAAAALDKGFTSVHWLVHAEVSDISFGEPVQHWGEPELTVPFRVNGKEFKFKTGPNNFFQNNVDGFSLILNTVADYLAKQDDNGQLLDLYCGVGTLGICLANYFDQVSGVELSTESVELAKHNAELNGVKNIQFQAGDVAKFLSTSNAETVIVDPPRAGLTPAGVEVIKQLNPARLIYISCNPVTQAQDLVALSADYHAVLNKCFDLFPQTYHLENLIILERTN